MSYTELGYTPGWCGQCGRRLGRDSRCGNCDPWWTSPIMHYIGGLAAIVTIVLVGIITISRTPSPLSSAGSGGAASASRGAIPPATLYEPALASAAAPAAPALTASQFLPVSIVNASGGAAHSSSPYTEDQLRFNDLVRLQQMTAYVDSVIAGQSAARGAASGANGGGLMRRPSATIDFEEGK